jgi:hypothetical protein
MDRAKGDRKSRSIGNDMMGSDFGPEYRARAEAHMPKTKVEVESAAAALAAQRYSDHTIAAILRIDVNAVRQMIGARESG